MSDDVFTFFVSQDRSLEIIQEVRDLLIDWSAGSTTLKEIIQSILDVKDEGDKNAYLFTLGFFLGYVDAIDNILKAARVINDGVEDDY